MVLLVTFAVLTAAPTPAAPGDVLQTVKVDCAGVGGLSWLDGALVVLTADGRDLIAVNAVDPADQRVIARAERPQLGVAVVGDAVWIGDERSFVELTARTSDEFMPVRTVYRKDGEPASGELAAFTHDGQYVWSGVVEGWSSRIVCQDVEQQNIVRWFYSRGFPESLTVSDGTLWSATSNMGRYPGTVYQYDAQTGKLLGSFRTPCLYPRGLAFDGHHLWCGDRDSGTLYQLALD